MSAQKIGREAEIIALNYERAVKTNSGSRKVISVSDQPHFGYDLHVIDPNEVSFEFKAIEVKAWSSKGHFIISSHEIATLKAWGDSAWIYIVDVKNQRVVKMIQNPFAANPELEPHSFKFFY